MFESACVFGYLQGKINGQYINEGLASSFMFAFAAMGFIAVEMVFLEMFSCAFYKVISRTMLNAVLTMDISVNTGLFICIKFSHTSCTKSSLKIVLYRSCTCYGACYGMLIYSAFYAGRKYGSDLQTFCPQHALHCWVQCIANTHLFTLSHTNTYTHIHTHNAQSNNIDLYTCSSMCGYIMGEGLPGDWMCG